jgi:phosphoglycolate phosphatase-like HAD superfamily hydrolase
MTYKILSTRQVDETLFTTVEYSFDANIVTAEVAHFMPKSEEEIKQNIINRASSEVARIEASATISTLVESIVIGEEKPII